MSYRTDLITKGAGKGLDRKTYKRQWYKEWRKKNPEKAKAIQKKHTSTALFKKKSYEYHLKRKFGLTIEQYDTLLLKQENRCAICDKHQLELGKRLDIDHDHISGKIRGLLCNACNQGIGLFGDSKELVTRALNYLKE